MVNYLYIVLGSDAVLKISQKDIDYLIKNLPFWSSLDLDMQNTVLEAATPIHFNKGDFLYEGSNACVGIYIIKSGQVRTYILHENGKEITLYYLLDRDISVFSASCVLRNISFDVFKQADCSTDAILIPVYVFEKLMKNYISVSDYINQVMSSRFSNVVWVMEQILFMSFDKRLAVFLTEHASLGNSLEIHMTHDTIAKHMGSAREVVTRMLKYFKNEGFVELSRGSIKILDIKALQKITSDNIFSIIILIYELSIQLIYFFYSLYS